MTTLTLPAWARSPRARGIVRETALTTAAALGVLCVLSAVVAPMFGMKLLVFQSGSMGPSIDTGAVAITRTVDASQLHKGDVVSVETEKGTRVTHRITAITPQGDQAILQLKGDANGRPDAEQYPVAEADRVVAHVNGLGYVVNALASPYAVFVAGAAATGLILLTFRRRTQGTTSVTGAEPEPDQDAGRHRGRRPGRRTAVVGAAVAAVLGAGMLTGPVLGGTVLPTLASFSDTAKVNGSAAVLTVPSPTGALGCANGGPFSGTVILSWTDVASSSSAYKYRVSVYLGDPANPVKTYDVSDPSVTVGSGDLTGAGMYNVSLSVSLDGTTWKSASSITRTIYSIDSWTHNCS